MKHWIFGTGALIFISGCNLEPHYDPPSVGMADQWKNDQQEDAVTLEYENWWDVFQDPLLSEFIEQAMENNQNLLAAEQRVEQARDIAKIAKSKLFPQLNLSPAYSNAGVLSQEYGPGLPHYPFVTREHQQTYALPLTMSYEVDLWGKVRSAYKAAKLGAKAQEEAYATAQLIITTDLANAYFQLRIIDAQIDLYQLILETRRTALEINFSRYEGELINFTDVSLSQQDLDEVESSYFELKQSRNLFENAIAVLLGMTPSEFSIDPSPLEDLPPVIPEGVPSSILLRRPDLAEQERNMESIHARLGIAYAAYFPSVDLLGALGWLSPLAGDFLHGISRYWMIGANINEVIFDASARYYNVQLTWAQFNEAVAQYRQSVLSAFQEVENALSNLQWVDKQMNSIENAVEASAIDSTLSTDSFNYGVVSYLPVMDKERKELDNEWNYLYLLSIRYSNTINLIKALGGGW